MKSENIKTMSLYVNGLNNPLKRTKVMTKNKMEKAQIAFLQETRLTQSEHYKQKRYGYNNVYYSLFKERSRRGVVILISNTVHFFVKMNTRQKKGDTLQ